MSFFPVRGFFFVLVVFIGFKLAEAYKMAGAWWVSYFEDLLALPVILSIALLIMRNAYYRQGAYCLSKLQVLMATAGVSVYFEGILPEINNQYTRDYWDILAYAMGAAFFYFGMNRITRARNLFQH